MAKMFDAEHIHGYAGHYVGCESGDRVERRTIGDMADTALASDLNKSAFLDNNSVLLEEKHEELDNAVEGTRLRAPSPSTSTDINLSVVDNSTHHPSGCA